MYQGSLTIFKEEIAKKLPEILLARKDWTSALTWTWKEVEQCNLLGVVFLVTLRSTIELIVPWFQNFMRGGIR